jgi:hypothetical protein
MDVSIDLESCKYNTSIYNIDRLMSAGFSEDLTILDLQEVGANLLRTRRQNPQSEYALVNAIMQ